MPVTTASLAEQLAEGVVRGIIGGLADNADKLPALAEALAAGWRSGWESRAVVSKPDPDETKALNDELQKAIDADALPRP